MPSAAQPARSRTSMESPASRAHAVGGLGQRGRRQRPGGLVHEIARARYRARGRACARERAFAVGGADVGGRPQDERRRRGPATALVGQVLVEAVAAQQRAFRGDLARASRRLRTRAAATRRTRRASRRRPSPSAPRTQPRRASAWPARIGSRAQSDERDALRTHVAHVHDQRLPELRAEALLAGRAPQDAADAGVGPVEELTVLELALADSERRAGRRRCRRGGRWWWRGQAWGGRACVRERARQRVKSPRQQFKARRRG